MDFGEQSSQPTAEQLMHELLIQKMKVQLLETELNVAARAVNEQRAELEEVILTAMDGFWITDLTGRFITVNDAFSRLIGYAKEELLGMSIQDVEAVEDAAMIQRRIRKVIRTGWDRFETRHRAKDGSLIDLEVNCRFSPAKQDGRFFVFIRNLTDQKVMERELEELRKTLEQRIWQRTRQLSESNARLELEIAEHRRLEDMLREANRYNRSLIEANPDPLVAIGRDGRITDVNSATEGATGYSREDLIGTDFSDYFTEPEMARAVYRKVFLEELVQDYELGLRHRDGDSVPVIYNASVYRDHAGEISGVFAAARDISVLKRVEEELREHRGQLEELVSQRTAQLVLAREEAEAANKAKSAFLANISHEIRTPINGIVGLVELLKSSELTDEQLEWLDGITLSGNNLLNIINDVLDLAKIEAGRLEVETIDFNLAGTVDEAVRSQRLVIEKKGLWIRVEMDPALPETVVGDPLRIKQVLLNLLSNAAKFTSQGGVTVSVQVVERRQRQVEVRLSVTDTGVGLSGESRERIFLPFCQGDSSTTRKYGGSGLGLAICKNLTDLMGGVIGCQSVLGKGSTFYFTLPLSLHAREQTRTPADAAPQIALPGPLTLLLVDDNDMNRLVISKLLIHMGHDVDCAENGMRALEMWQGRRYDAIIMDVQMPEMDGIQTTRAIRERERSSGAHTPIIALTAIAFPGDRDDLLGSGFDAYASKPISVKDLVGQLGARVSKVEDVESSRPS